MSKDTSITLSRNTKAGGLVAASVLLLSLFPVVVAFSSSQSPFLFACIWQIGLVLGLVFFLAVRYSDLFRCGATWRQVWRHTPSVAMVMWIASQFQNALFVWSASLVDVAITTVISEAWPLGLVLLTAWLFRSEGRYRKIGPLTALAFLAAAAGVALVALSHAGDIHLTRMGEYVANAPYALVGGVGLALGTAVLTSLNSFSFRWGANLAGDLPQDGKHDTASLEVFSIVVGFVVCSLFAIPGLALFGFARDEALVPSSLWWALFGGTLLGAGGTIFWRYGILMTTDLKIQVITYFSPLFSLAWLYSLSLVGDVDGGLLFGGAVIIVVANLIVWVEGRQPAESSAPAQPRDIDVHQLLADGESATVEFKENFRHSRSSKSDSKHVQQKVVEALVAMLNSRGGVVLIGVGEIEDGSYLIAGIEPDDFPDEDNMKVVVDNLVVSELGPGAVSRLHQSFHDYKGKRLMAIQCEPPLGDQHFAYLRELRKDGRRGDEQFLIRRGASSIALSHSQKAEYARSRFGS